MKRVSFIVRMILACLTALLQIPSLLAIRIALEVSKNQASTIVQNADGSYQMVTEPLKMCTIFLSYVWIWGIVLLCLAASVAIPIVLGVRRGAPCIAVIAIGTGVTVGQAVLAALFTLLLPSIYEFDLHAFMFMRYDLSVLYNLIPGELALYAGKLLLVALGVLFGACALLALALTVTELALSIGKAKANRRA